MEKWTLEVKRKRKLSIPCLVATRVQSEPVPEIFEGVIKRLEKAEIIQSMEMLSVDDLYEVVKLAREEIKRKQEPNREQYYDFDVIRNKRAF